MFLAHRVDWFHKRAFLGVKLGGSFILTTRNLFVQATTHSERTYLLHKLQGHVVRIIEVDSLLSAESDFAYRQTLLGRAQCANVGAVSRPGTLEYRYVSLGETIGFMIAAGGFPEVILAVFLAMYDGEELLQPSLLGQTDIEWITYDLR